MGTTKPAPYLRLMVTSDEVEAIATLISLLPEAHGLKQRLSALGNLARFVAHESGIPDTEEDYPPLLVDTPYTPGLDGGCNCALCLTGDPRD